ncbi:MAG TPA: hypothetical protein VNM45_17495 [Bacillus sp. (in: firmicutes)]|nr:hypothetical protein [Bacillus sp. (in: firmicutes)]
MLNQSTMNAMQAAGLKGEFIWGMKEGKQLLKGLPKEVVEKAIELTEYPSHTLNEEVIENYMSTLRILNFVKYKQVSFASVLFGAANAAVKLNVLHKIESAIDELS